VCVGGYQFEKVEGDHFTIPGLPMFPLLAEFRRMGVLTA
jgi:predicted house-cleaning NTP pyrophosphatase (Maf/HAM1 superfamily)